MLFETVRNSRRLFRPGEPSDPARDGAKIVPDRKEIPAKYHELLDWYESEYVRARSHPDIPGPLISLRGSGKHLWADEPADQYVRRLREEWE